MIGACLLSSVPAHADDDATATSAARERFKEGVAYFDQKQYEKARAAFVQAYALKKHPAVLLNLAQSELRSNHERDAAKHFSTYLREATDASAAEREAAQAGLTAAKAVVGEIQINAESGGEVLVDGTSEGVAPLPGAVYVDPGTHTLELKKGERTASQTVSVKAGETKEARLALSTEAVAAPAAAARPGEEKPAEPEADESTSRSTGKREPFLHWVTTSPAGVIPAGAAVLLGLGAGGFAIASNLAYSEAEDIGMQIEDNARMDMASTQGICSDPSAVLMQAGYPADKVELRAGQYTNACSQHTDSTERGDSFKTFAIVSGIGAGALAITTVVLYLTTAPDERVSTSSSAPLSLDVIPAVAPGAASLSVVGRF